jgi:hypothetical protein
VPLLKLEKQSNIIKINTVYDLSVILSKHLKSEINRIDHEIDQMVYELYGLTEEEIKIIEQA